MNKLKFGVGEWGDHLFRMKRRQSHGCTGERKSEGVGVVLALLGMTSPCKLFNLENVILKHKMLGMSGFLVGSGEGTLHLGTLGVDQRWYSWASQPGHRRATLWISRNYGKNLGLSGQWHWLGSVPLSLWSSRCQGATAGIFEMSWASKRGTEEVVGVPQNFSKRLQNFSFESVKHCSFLEQIIGLNGFWNFFWLDLWLRERNLKLCSCWLPESFYWKNSKESGFSRLGVLFLAFHPATV